MKVDDLLKPRKQSKKVPKYNWTGSGKWTKQMLDLSGGRSVGIAYYGIPTAIVQSGTGEDTIGAGAGITGVSDAD